MPKIIDLNNKNIGEWIVIGRAKDHVYPSGRKDVKWKCQCSCGKIQDIFASHLKAGKSTCCLDCKYKYKISINGKVSSRTIQKIKTGAKNRKIHFDKNIDRDFLQKLYEKQNGKCALSGEKICFSNTIKEDIEGATTASLDRIDSSKGYVKSNIQWVHKDVNKMKSNLDEELFKKYCKLVCDH